MKTYNNPFSLAIDNFLNQNVSEAFGLDNIAFRPAVNFKEDSHKFIYEVALPGIEKENIKLEIDKNVLKISAVRSSESESGQEDTTEKKYIRREFNYSKFERQIHLPETSNTESISAGYEKGILTISIDKKEEAIDNGPISIKIS